MQNKMINYLKKRFNPITYLPIITLLFLTFYTHLNQNSDIIKFSIDTVLIFILVLLIFFDIRLIDDIKDYSKDKKNIFKISSIKKILIAIFILEILISILIGFYTILIFLIISIYLLLIYYDFFIREKIKKHRFFSNFLHQIIVILIGVFINIAYHNSFDKLTFDYFLILFLVYLIVACFEIVRKIKKQIYEEILGKKRYISFLVVLLILISFTASEILYEKSNVILIGILIFFIITMISSILYLKKEKIISNKKLKLIILMFLLVVIISLVLSGIQNNIIVFNEVI